MTNYWKPGQDEFQEAHGYERDLMLDALYGRLKSGDIRIEPVYMGKGAQGQG